MASPSLYALAADIGGQLSALFGATVTWDFGPDARWANAAPPRVVFVPEPGESFGPIDVSTYYPGKNATLPRNQRAIATRKSTMKAHVWAASPTQPPATGHDDHDVTEQLVNAVMFAAWTTARGSVRFSDGVWLALEGDGGLHLGTGYVLTMELDSPVVQPSVTTTATVTSLPQDNRMQFPDGQQVATP